VSHPPPELLTRLRRLWSAAFPSEDPTAPECWPKIEGYEILGVLGRGGMGIVYRARQNGLGREVAVKMLAAGQWSSAQDARRLLKEAETAAQLQHNHIVPVYAVGQYRELPYCVMELITGGSLAQRVADLVAAPREAARLIADAARALHYAHLHGICHRDVKPANVLLRVRGPRLPTAEHDATAMPASSQPRLCDVDACLSDFGLARRTLDEAGLTQQGAVIGTPGYVAPEQIRSERPSPVADVYGLGAVLYECLTGQPPFQATTPFDTLLLTLQKEPERPRVLNSRLPLDLETVCLKCLDKEPRQRYATAEALADDLERWLGGNPVCARPVSPLGRAWRWCRRNPLRVSLVGIGLASSIATMIAVERAWYAAELRLERDGKEIARAAAVEAQGQAEEARNRETQAKEKEAALREELARLYYYRQIESAYQFWQRGRVNHVTETLDACLPSLRNWEWHYVNHLCRSSRLELRGHTGHIRGVAFSGDGKLIAAADGSSIRIWDASTGKAKRVIDNINPGPLSLVFPGAGQRLIADFGRGKQANGIVAWDASDGTERRLDQEISRSCKVSPGGKYSVLANGNGLSVRRIESGEEQCTIQPVSDISDMVFSIDEKCLVTWRTRDGKVDLYDVESGKHIGSLQDTAGRITTVAVAGQLVALGFDNGMVSFWNPAGGRPIWSARPHLGEVTGIVFAGRDRVVSASSDGSVKLLDVARKNEPWANRQHTGGVRAVACSPDGQQIVTGGEDGLCFVTNLGNPEGPGFVAHQPGNIRVSISKDGRRFASCGSDGVGKVWDCETLGFISELRGHKGPFRAITFGQDSGTVVTSGMDGTIRTWEASSGRETRVIRPRTNAVAAIASHPNQPRFAIAYAGAPAVVWDLEAGRIVKELPIENGVGVTFSPDGTLLAVAAGGTRTELFDSETWCSRGGVGQIAKDGASDTVVFSSKGDRLITAGRDQDIRIWDIASGELLRVLRGHSARVRGLQVFAGDERLVSVGSDKSVRIWDLATGAEVLNVSEFTRDSETVAVHPSDLRIFTGSTDGRIKVWETR
jgi:eukaryotic-like serine/threonine-protein kinase